MRHSSKFATGPNAQIFVPLASDLVFFSGDTFDILVNLKKIVVDRLLLGIVRSDTGCGRVSYCDLAIKNFVLSVFDRLHFPHTYKNHAQKSPTKFPKHFRAYS